MNQEGLLMNTPLCVTPGQPFSHLTLNVRINERIGFLLRIRKPDVRYLIHGYGPIYSPTLTPHSTP